MFRRNYMPDEYFEFSEFKHVDSAQRPTLSRFFVTVHPGQGVLERHDGRPTVVLAPGRHRRKRRASYDVVDLRQRLDQVAMQEITAADGLSVKVSAVVRGRVTDPILFTEATADPIAAVYLAVQIALRETMLGIEAEDAVRSGRADLAHAATGAARTAGADVGLDVRDVLIKDIVLPMELRQATAELVLGRQRALAQLEAARAETAALRALANGAKLLDEHPALAQLRLVQALPMGSTVELKQ